jgi:hypothetical protein
VRRIIIVFGEVTEYKRIAEHGGGLTSDLDSDGRFIPQSTSSTNQQQNNNDSSSGNPKPIEVRSPVIFVLGGPGSGKITHCDRAVQERTGLAHVNMTDLIQQHVVGNGNHYIFTLTLNCELIECALAAGLEDFSGLPASNLVEVLQMEMKMAVNSKGFLVSGYPRSMRDVVEYQNRVGCISTQCHVAPTDDNNNYSYPASTV